MIFFRGLPGWFRTQYIWMLLLVPVIWSSIIYGLADANIMGWGEARICKAFMEVVHPSLLATGTLLAVAGWIFTRETSLAFLGVLCAFALSREIGGQGSSIILYMGLLGLIVYGHANRRKIKTLIDSAWATSFMASCFICYAVSQLFDRGVVKRLGWLFTWDTSWKPPYSNQIEESLEALGGGFLLLAVIATLILAMRRHGKPNPSEFMPVNQ